MNEERRTRLYYVVKQKIKHYTESLIDGCSNEWGTKDKIVTTTNWLLHETIRWVSNEWGTKDKIVTTTNRR